MDLAVSAGGFFDAINTAFKPSLAESQQRQAFIAQGGVLVVVVAVKLNHAGNGKIFTGQPGVIFQAAFESEGHKQRNLLCFEEAILP